MVCAVCRKPARDCKCKDTPLVPADEARLARPERIRAWVGRNFAAKYVDSVTQDLIAVAAGNRRGNPFERNALEAIFADKESPQEPLRFEVEAEVVAADGGSDGAYGLIGTWTAEEFLDALRAQLQQPVRETLYRGATDPVGYALKISIYDVGSRGEDANEE
jgi:hypothetical protein